MMNKRPLELYIHIPFCARKCAYCDFLSFAVPERVYQDYMDKLIEEIYGQSLCFSDWNVTSIFLGGGTPSLLPPKFIEELFAVLYGCFSIEEDAEITIEANPGTLTMEKLEVYQESGINRLSLGLQSADDQELRVLGRIHTFDDFLKSYQRARQAGFTNISVDLMSALPGQDVHSWKNTLRKVIMLKPEHISAYSLIVEEGTLFYEWYGDMGSSEGGMVRRDERKGGEREDSLARSVLPGDKKSRRMELPPLPDEDTDREIYHMTKEFLAGQGYERYEISNYAKKGYECRHNTKYWIRTDYLGLGLGAASLWKSMRFHNEKNLEQYIKFSYDFEKLHQNIEKLTKEDAMSETMFLGLRRMEGVSKQKFYESFHIKLEDIYKKTLQKMKECGCLEENEDYVWLTKRGIDVSNLVMCEFIL